MSVVQNYHIVGLLQWLALGHILAVKNSSNFLGTESISFH